VMLRYENVQLNSGVSYQNKFDGLVKSRFLDGVVKRSRSPAKHQTGQEGLRAATASISERTADRSTSSRRTVRFNPEE
jgi:hypothetical protein